MYIGYMMLPLGGHGRHDHGVRRVHAAQRPARNAPPPAPAAAGDPGRRAASLVWYAIRNSRANREYFGM
ncbi:MAG: hypothetical protein ACLU3I_10625 [Acutalibacteraceae bacterium]